MLNATYVFYFPYIKNNHKRIELTMDLCFRVTNNVARAGKM